MAATSWMHLPPSLTSLKQPSSSLENKPSRARFFIINCESSSPKTTRRVALTSVLLCGAAASIPAALAFSESNFVPMMEGLDLPGFKKMDTGVLLQDIIEGSGEPAAETDSVEFNYVCRRSNGYFVYSTMDQFSGESSPVTLSLKSGGKMIDGLRSVLVGMKPGGKRRAIVPPKAGYITTDLEPQPTEFGPQRSLLSHIKEPLLFEVQLLKIK